LVVCLAYDGGWFHGWQVQSGLPTIQGMRKKVVSSIEGRPLHVAAAPMPACMPPKGLFLMSVDH